MKNKGSAILQAMMLQQRLSNVTGIVRAVSVIVVEPASVVSSVTTSLSSLFRSHTNPKPDLLPLSSRTATRQFQSLCNELL